jgi:uncharacterized protein DUF6600
MKRILLALTMAGLLLPLIPRAQAAEVSLNFFYDNLSSQGSWIEVADYGYCFQPNVAVSNSDWRPYSDGYWAYTDAGWTWVSYEDFGWATYHYGRWSNLADYGWVWVPGYEWGPAWVSWRTGGDYVGWAPLPPGGATVYEGRAITGGVDVEFGIGPLYYNFVDVRYIGEPVLRDRILASSRNVTIINQTVNVTNITYNNSIVYNYGPDYNRLNQYSTRPIQRLTLQRETTVGAELGQGRKGNLNRVSGNQLTVVAPTIQKSQQQIAPKQVKAKVEKPTIEHGWQGVQNRQQLEAEMKQENPKNISAPSFQPQKNRKREAVAGAEQTADQGAQAPAEQQQGAAQNAAAAGEQTQQNDQNAKRAEAQRNQHENQNRKNRRVEPAAAPETAAPEAGEQAGAGQSEQTQQTENQKPERRQKAQQRRAQQTDENAPQAETAQPERGQRGNRADQAQERKAQPASQNDQQAETAQPDREQGTNRAQRPRKTQQAERNQQPDTEKPDNNRARRAERTQQAPEAQQADRERPAEQANRAQRAERPQQNRRAEQARPQEQSAQGNQNPNNQRKGKKKKPSEEPSPQP